MNRGDIVAFVDENDSAVYGEIIGVHEKVSDLLDIEGRLFRVPNARLLRAGEPDKDGIVLMSRIAHRETRSIGSENVTARVTEEWEIRRQTQELLAEPVVRSAIKRLAKVPVRGTGLVAKLDLSVPEPRRRGYEAWEIPLAIVTRQRLDGAGTPQWTQAFESYIFMSEARRQRFDGVLNRLKERAPVQHKVYVACVIHGMRQVDVCRAYGLKSGNVAVQLRKAKDFIQRFMGKNVFGATGR